MKYNSAPTPCETFSYGEVEDYTIVISGTDSPYKGDFIDSQELGNDLPTHISVCPNPANSTISVVINDEISSSESIVKIYNSEGALVKTVTLNTPVDVSAFTAGIYVVIANHPKETLMTKFVKE